MTDLIEDYASVIRFRLLCAYWSHSRKVRGYRNLLKELDSLVCVCAPKMQQEGVSLLHEELSLHPWPVLGDWLQEYAIAMKKVSTLASKFAELGTQIQKRYDIGEAEMKDVREQIEYFFEEEMGDPRFKDALS